MSIEKRVVPVSFVCNPDGVEGLSYDVTYYPGSDNVFDIEISGDIKVSDEKKHEISSIKCPVEYPVSLFVEIVDFLRKEKFIEKEEIVDKIKDVNNDLDNLDNDLQVSQKNKLPLPKINPISSFDDKDVSKSNFGEEDIKNDKKESDKKEIKKDNKDETSKEETTGELLKRPLIKTRVDDEDKDPLKAEREAKILRDKMVKKDKHQIKRKEE